MFTFLLNSVLEDRIVNADRTRETGSIISLLEDDGKAQAESNASLINEVPNEKEEVSSQSEKTVPVTQKSVEPPQLSRNTSQRSKLHI